MTNYHAFQVRGGASSSWSRRICGLGHLGVQYAKKLGHRVAVIARGSEKRQLAADLGGDHYIDSLSQDPAEALLELSGAAAILATAASGTAMTGLLGGLRPHGALVVVGAAPDPIEVSTADLIFGSRRIIGSSIDNEDNLAFSMSAGIMPMIEPMPFRRAPEAYERMMSGQARFRVVLDFTHF